MIEILSPTTLMHVLARMLGESERTARTIVLGSMAMAVAAAMAWVAVQTVWTAPLNGHAGSAQVVQALVATMALLFAVLPVALLAAAQAGSLRGQGPCSARRAALIRSAEST